MKAHVCELCGSNEIVKQDGYYVCQHCGTKYSPEEAKKMLVEVTGSVTVDNSAKLQNYYQLARRAANENNANDAAKYYDLIRQEEPDSWEANFFSIYFQSMQTTIAYIPSAAMKVANCVPTVFALIAKTVSDPEERINAVAEVGYRCQQISEMMYKSALSTYNNTGDGARQYVYKDFLERGCAARDIALSCGNLIEQIFGAEYAKNMSSNLWTTAISQQESMFGLTEFRTEGNANLIEKYAKKIQQYQPSYEAPEVKTGGCYVATSIYGSYDCPQVWVLRRFRDNTLAETWYGRALIRAYYAISPTLVKWYGDAEWFRNLWKPKLDRMVKRLKKQGVVDTPYQDKQW